MSRSLLRGLFLTAVLAVVGFLALPAGAAAAHPLGNFSVNRYAGLTLHPDRIDALVVADLAELPTLQDSAPSCTEAATALHVSADGAALPWTIKNTSLTYAAGAGGLRTTRLECQLSAPVDISRQLRVDVTNQFRGDRIGWHELVATGSGVKLPDSPLPTASSTNELRSYPTDPLASPLDTRSASFTATPGSEPSSAVPGPASATAAPGSEPSSVVPGAASVTPAPGSESSSVVPGAASVTAAPGSESSSVVPGAASVTAAPGSEPSSAMPGPASAPAAVEGNGSTGLLAGAERTLEDLIGGKQLTPLIGLLAVLLSLLLGAAHAALPGHGKTVMAAYLVGSRGRPRDAVLVGATVTFTHTAGVIALGLLLTSVTTLAGESVLAWLGVASGTLVTGVGIGALTSALRRRHHTVANHFHPDQPAILVHAHTSTARHEPTHPQHTRAHPDHDRSGPDHDRSGPGHDRSGPGHGHSHPGHGHPRPDHGDSRPTPSGPRRSVSLGHVHADADGREGSHPDKDPHPDSGVILGHVHADSAVGREHTHPAGATSPRASHAETEAGHSHRESANSQPHAEDAGLHGGVRARTEHGHDHSHVARRRRAFLHGHHHGHSHSQGDGHDHGPGKWGIAGLGVAGGLVPSPSALIVLLGAAALGRTVFGVLLVLAYGLGMAATLTAAGLLLVRLRHRLEGRRRLADRWRAISPSATAALIIVVGLGLAGRALTGLA